jgi:transposase
MDTSVERTTDRLGRPTGPRRKYTTTEKLAILAETRRRGASVAEVARAHGINANLLFGWRRLERRGGLRTKSSESTEPATLLPVRVESPTVVPGRRRRAITNGEDPAAAEGVIEIELGGGVRVRLRGAVDGALLARVLEALRRR